MSTKLYMEANLIEFDKNCNLNFTQLFYAWLQILKRDLHGSENEKSNIYLIFWDGSINVIFAREGFNEVGKELEKENENRKMKTPV